MSGPSRSKHKFIVCLILLFSLLFSYGFSGEKRQESFITTLSPKIKAKVSQYPNLVCGIYIKPSWISGRNNAISINGNTSFPAASLIKIPIAVVLLKKVDENKISWNQTLTLKHYHYAQGAGLLRTKKAGTKFKLSEVFRLMLTISDNTATNMIIDLLGGISVVNQEITKLGLKNTKLNNWLGDFKGTNKTSPEDLVFILDESLHGEILSKSSKRIFKDTLLEVKNKSLIKQGLGKYTKFAHKTGTIGICVGDAGIIYYPRGKRLSLSVIVKRPFNSLQGQKLIREVSNIIYNEHR